MVAASVIVSTITKIIERTSSVPASGDNKNNTNTITENIKRHLLTIKEVAEHNDVAAATPSPNWLFDLTDTVTDLWDLLEDQDLQKQSRNNITCSLSSVCNHTPRMRNPLPKLGQIEKKLQHIIGAEPLQKDIQEVVSNSLRIIRYLYGRKELVEQIISQVLALKEMEGSVNVVTILGMRGMGKTVIAYHICFVDEVQKGFDRVIRIDCIHDGFYANSVIERIINESTMKDEGELLNLGEAMSGRRFLLVVDDLQFENSEEWIMLMNNLNGAARSHGAICTILVTTQNFLVHTEVIRSSAFLLPALNEKSSWDLFTEIAGRRILSGSKNIHAIKKLVKKCRGVPLAIEKMAGVLINFGEAITEPEEIEFLEEKFMQEMKFIYYDGLPSWHQKQCFAYLSMILASESDWVDANTLIRLWMAEGILGPGPVNSNSNSNSNSSEQLQEEYLGRHVDELFHSSILRLSDYTSHEIIELRFSVYNELMLDLSRFVASKDYLFFFMDDGGDNNNVKETFCRVALAPESDVSKGITKLLDKKIKNEDLRTLVFLTSDNNGWPSRIPYEVKLKWSSIDAIFHAFKNLRVLNLTDLGMKVLPVSIGGLKSLRYLDLSRNNMQKLPNSIGKLKHLQTLILSHCHHLRELPNEVKHLVSLRHLVMEGCLNLTHLPLALKKLTNLQTLSLFMVSNSQKQSHLSLGELVNMNNLSNKLEISHLERLKFVRGTSEHAYYLKEKEKISILDLQWNHHEDEHDGDEGNDDQISLGYLEPHSNLQVLLIRGYRGANFSNWLSSLKNLTNLYLYNCSNCKILPPLDQLSQLNILQLKGLESLEYITDQDNNYNELVLGRLFKLVIWDCPNLMSWWKGRTHNKGIAKFGFISTMKVQHCPKLECMPLFPNLQFFLVLEGSSVKPLLETIKISSTSLSKLSKLEIKNVEAQSPLPRNWLKNFISLDYLCIGQKIPLIKGLKHLSSLKVLRIKDCERVDLACDDWEGLRSLQYLYIEGVTEMNSLPEGIKHLASLFLLGIEGCPKLTTLTEGISSLTSLRNLVIVECKKLASLPKGMTNLTSLSMLRIRNCPLLLPRCQKETGEDWPQIKHIEFKSLEDTPEIYDDE